MAKVSPDRSHALISKLSSVTLAGIDAGSITKQEATRIELVAAASPNAKRGDVVLTSENGAQIAMVNGWAHVNPPQINELDPDEGQVGTTVTVSGADMLAGAEKIESATLAGTAVSSIASSNATHVVVVAGKKTGDAEGVVVLVADSGATVTSALNWTYTNASVITKVEPASGQHKTEVVISGERMHGGGSKIVTVLLADAVATIDAETTNEINVTMQYFFRPQGLSVLKISWQH